MVQAPRSMATGVYAGPLRSSQSSPTEAYNSPAGHAIESPAFIGLEVDIIAFAASGGSRRRESYPQSHPHG